LTSAAKASETSSAETELTLSKTLEIARGMEAADCNAQKLKGAEERPFE